MHEWWLVIVFCLLSLIALLLAIYPLRMHWTKTGASCIGIFIIVLILAYQQWGGWSAWRQYAHEQVKLKEAKSLLATIKSPEELVAKLRAKLNDTPESAKGWYLLGRLYASQNQWTQARDAFAKSHQLNAKDEQVTVNYAESLFQLHHQRVNEKIRRLLNEILENNPKQPDALAMLALDAYYRKEYSTAIDYWQRLLLLAPPNSKERKAIQKAIAKARQKQ